MNLSKIKNPLIFLGASSLLSFGLQSEEFMNYQVKENDSLSKILFRHKFFPIYGEDGSLKKVIDLNIGQIKKNGNLIKKGITIILPIKVIEQVTERSIANVEDEVPHSEEENEVPLVVIPEIAPENHLSEDLESNFQQYSYFSLAPRLGSLSINTVDNVNLGGVDVSNITKSAAGVRGEWRVMVRPQQSLFAFSNVDFINFYNDSKYSLSNTDFIRTSFGVGQSYGLNSKSSIETSVQSNQNYFLDVISPDNIQIRQMSQIELQARYLRDLLQVGQVYTKWGAGGMIMLPSTRENFKSSFGYGFNLDWTTKFLTNEFQLLYMQKFYKINNMNNQSRELMLNFHFQFGRKE